MSVTPKQITSDKVCLLSPKAGVIPPMMTVLMSFQREVWMMTVITCIIVTVIYYVATAIDSRRPRPTGCNLGLEIYRMFIGAPTDKIFAYSCQRILTAFCLIFTLVILNAFQVTIIFYCNTTKITDTPTSFDYIHCNSVITMMGVRTYAINNNKR